MQETEAINQPQKAKLVGYPITIGRMLLYHFGTCFYITMFGPINNSNQCSARARVKLSRALDLQYFCRSVSFS